jgi:cytolysin-activating lysine-acyltransferase
MSYERAIVDGLYMFSQSPEHIRYTISDFNRYLVYPVLHDKCRIFYEDEKPIGLVTWAWLTNEEVDAFLSTKWALDETTYQRDTGDQLWGMDFIAPFGHTRLVMRRMRQISKDLYGDTKCHWRRLHNPLERHIRRF